MAPLSVQLAQIHDREEFRRQAVRRLALAHTQGHAEVSLILVSIDHFRECGGAAAGICLHSVAEVILDNLDPAIDLVGRSREHEFALMPAIATQRSTQELAGRIRAGVEALDLRPTTGMGPLTVSVSVVTHVPRPDRSIEALLIEGDHGIREAERNGGNCVIRPAIGGHSPPRARREP